MGMENDSVSKNQLYTPVFGVCSLFPIGLNARSNHNPIPNSHCTLVKYKYIHTCIYLYLTKRKLLECLCTVIET